jgi:hypothetical protein
MASDLQQLTPAAQAWPAGVTHRYLNLAGATVDISTSPATGKTHALCGGCPWTDDSTTPGYVHGKAQAHAERCRALPRPTTGGTR